MPSSAAPRKAPLPLAVSDDYGDGDSLIVDDTEEALRLVRDFFARVGSIQKRGETSVKALLQHPDGYECIVKAKIKESSTGSRLQLSKRSGDSFVFSLTFRLVREALRLDGLPPAFFHGQIYSCAERSPAPDAADMSDLELPPTRESGLYEWPKEQFLDFTEQHKDILNRLGELDVPTFITHVNTIPRSLLDARSISPTMCNVFETCEKIYELLSDARAFWAKGLGGL